jgi:alkyl hydroperoxide reductase 1
MSERPAIAYYVSGIPTNYNASKEWADKKVVLFAVPGAFTPGCSVRHLPGYIEKLEEIKGKSVDVVAVIAFNDAFVMSAWGKANGIKNEDILFLSDPESKFSKGLGWNMGERSARYAIIIDKGKVVYAEKEPARDVTVMQFLPRARLMLTNKRSPVQLRCLPSCRDHSSRSFPQSITHTASSGRIAELDLTRLFFVLASLKRTAELDQV